MLHYTEVYSGLESESRSETPAHSMDNDVSSDRASGQIQPEQSIMGSQYSRIPVSNVVALPPPPYEDAINDPIPTTPTPTNAPPPTYDSLYGRVCEAQKQTAEARVYLSTCVCGSYGPLCMSVCTTFACLVPISMIIMGLLYMNSCPIGEYIPVYLIVGGFLGLIRPMLNLTTYVRRNAEARRLERQRQVQTKNIADWFMIGWFLIGSYWVYRIYEPNYDPNLGAYCDAKLYFFSFWIVSSVYLFFGFMISLMFTCTILVLCFLTFFSRKEISELRAQSMA